MKRTLSPREIVSRQDYAFWGLMSGAEESVPVGNGEIGANVWLEADGLHLLLSRIDSFSEQYRLLKTGHLRIGMSPNPFGSGTVTTLKLWDGCLTIEAQDGSCITLFADANAPVYSVALDFARETDVEAEAINYRTREKALRSDDESNNFMYGCKGELLESADLNYAEGLHSIGQYHCNEHSCYDYAMRLQWLEGFSGYDDPFLGLTFGFLAHSKEMNAVSSTRLKTAQPVRSSQLAVVSHACRCTEAEAWKVAVLKLCEGWKFEGAFERHVAYWHGKWEESWADVWGSPKADTIMRGYTLQRYMNFCAGRGRLPVKFNGSLFTMFSEDDADGLKNYDCRQWGAPYWIQNTRLIYWNMLFAGDYDLMPPLFDMYRAMLPLAEYRVQKYFRHAGALIPEAVAFFGAYQCYYDCADPKKHPGRLTDSGYISWYFSGILELTYLMARYHRQTRSAAFLSGTLAPFAQSALRFFLEHNCVRDGRLVIKPTSALETWQDCMNDLPTVAGLAAVTEELLNLGEDIGPELESLCREVAAVTPPLPLREGEGGAVLSPCEINMDPVRRNSENPELYAVFPYFRHTLWRGDLALARRTYAARDVKGSPGWAQDAIQAALLGLADETYALLAERFAARDPRCAFPAFWGPNCDETPDQDHGTVSSTALLLSLVQSDEQGIRLLPAWNRSVNAAFRLPLYGGGDIECVYEGGTLCVIALTGHEAGEILD